MSAGSPPGQLERLGRWCARHWVAVIVLWIVVIGVVHGLQSAFGGTYADDFQLPGTPSQTGIDVLRAHDPKAGGLSGTVVLRDRHASLTTQSGPLG